MPWQALVLLRLTDQNLGSEDGASAGFSESRDPEHGRDALQRLHGIRKVIGYGSRVWRHIPITCKLLGNRPRTQGPCILHFNLNKQLYDVPGGHHVTLSEPGVSRGA